MDPPRRSVTLAYVLVGALPVLLLGGVHLASTVSDAVDPCVTWGTSWSRDVRGGGTSPGPAGCEAGTRWTTEARGHALLAASWLPAAGAGALVLGLWGSRRGVALPLVGGSVLLLGAGALLTLGLTAVVAFMPTAAFAAAARAVDDSSRSARWARLGVGGALGIVAVAFGASVVAGALRGGFRGGASLVVVFVVVMWLVLAVGALVYPQSSGGRS